MWGDNRESSHHTQLVQAVVSVVSVAVNLFCFIVGNKHQWRQLSSMCVQRWFELLIPETRDYSHCYLGRYRVKGHLHQKTDSLLFSTSHKAQVFHF